MFEWIQHILSGVSITGISGFGYILFRSLRNKRFQNAIFKLLVKLWKNIINKHLLAHYLFKQAEKHKERAKNIEFQISDHKIAFDILIKEKIDTVIELTRIWEKENRKKLKDIKLNQLQKSLRKLIDDMIPTYEEKIKQEYLKKFDFVKGLQYYNDMYVDIFKPYHEPNVKPIINLLDNIMDYEDDNDELIENFFGRIESAISMAVDDAKETFKELENEKKEKNKHN